MAERSVSEQFFSAMEAEINRERAAVLGRCGERLEKAIANCEAIRADAESGDEVALERYRHLRRDAVDATERLCLQREMIRVYDHSWVGKAYPLPPKL